MVLRSYGNIVARLKKEGTIALYHDYRVKDWSTGKGSLIDHSGNGFTGNAEGVLSWTKNGYVFSDDQYIWIPYSAALNTELTRDALTFIFVFDDLVGDSTGVGDKATWMSSAPADSTSYHLWISTDDTGTEYTSIASVDSGSTSRTHSVSNSDGPIVNKKRRCVAFACKGSTTTVSTYVDGTLLDTDASADYAGIKTSNYDLRIGNVFDVTDYGAPCKDGLQAVMILSKQVTAAEAKQLSAYLLSFHSGDLRRAFAG